MKTCEICGKAAHHRHHIQSRSQGGNNNPSNIALLCASDHMEVHLGNIIIEGRFLTDDGYLLIYHKKGELSITGNLPECFTY